MLEPLFNPDELNARLPRTLRIASVVLLAAGAGLALVIAYDTVRRWSTLPHPAGFLVFVLAAAALAIWAAARLAVRRPIANPVTAPPRPFIVRVLGLLVFVFGGLAALVSDSLGERFSIGTLALAGLGWFLWPARGPGHAA